jgi:hypothetical protein
MKRRERKKSTMDTVSRATRSAAKVFGTALVTTALVFGIPGCKREFEVDEKSMAEFELEKAKKKEFEKLLSEKTGHPADVYFIRYPEFFVDMLDRPFDKEDGVYYEFVYHDVEQEKVVDIVRGLVEALDFHYLEHNSPLMKDDDTPPKARYTTELTSIHYDAEKGKGRLEVTVQFEETKEPVLKKTKKKKRKK